MPRGDGIKPINQLFEKYKQNLVAPQGSVIKCFCEVVYDLYALEVTETMVEYSVGRRTLILRARGPLKTELLLRRTEILQHLKGRLGERSAPQNIF